MLSYSEYTTAQHRKKFAQHYTSPSIANFMINWLLQFNPDVIFDPAFGMGVFYHAAKKQGYKGDFNACELDKKSFEFFSSQCNPTDLSLHLANYFEFNAPLNLMSIVCNPPYLKSQNFLHKTESITALKQQLGEAPPSNLNMATAFLLKSVHELAIGGHLAYLMPLEFLNSRYGERIKQYLLDYGRIHEIIMICDEKNAFEGNVLTTACIILYEKTTNQEGGDCTSMAVNFSVIHDAKQVIPKRTRSIPQKDLNSKQKWLKYFDEYEHVEPHKGFVPLSSYGKFTRGIATGCNDFFVVNKETIQVFGFDSSEFVPCIARSQQITSSTLTDEMIGEMIESNERVYLFSPRVDYENLSEGGKAYHDLGIARGCKTSYLAQERKTWFHLDRRDPSPILCGVFFRNKPKFIRNYTSAVTLTCFHGFIPNEQSLHLIDALYAFLISDFGTKLLMSHRRQYGNKLSKFEPSDLNNLLVPPPDQLERYCIEMAWENFAHQPLV